MTARTLAPGPSNRGQCGPRFRETFHPVRRCKIQRSGNLEGSKPLAGGRGRRPTPPEHATNKQKHPGGMQETRDIDPSSTPPRCTEIYGQPFRWCRPHGLNHRLIAANPPGSKADAIARESGLTWPCRAWEPTLLRREETRALLTK